MSPLRKRLQTLEEKHAACPKLSQTPVKEMTDAQLLAILTAATGRESFTDEELQELIDGYTP